MIRLNLPREPHWLDLPHGVRLKVRPLTTAIYEAARARMGRIIRELLETVKDNAGLGLRLEGIPDLTDKDALSGYSQYMFSVALAQAAIMEWQGVADAEGAPLAMIPENVARLMDVPALAESFVDRYTAPLAAMVTEGNVSASAPNGTMAAGANTAAGATNAATPAPAASAA
jgi:hypothetical protein